MGAMTMDLEVWLEGADEPVLVVADQRDMAAFELQYKVGTNVAMDSMTMRFFRYVAWAALRRTNQTEERFDRWDKAVISAGPPEDEDGDGEGGEGGEGDEGDEDGAGVEADPTIPAA